MRQINLNWAIGCLLFAILGLGPADLAAQLARRTPERIWAPLGTAESISAEPCYFRKTFLVGTTSKALLEVSSDGVAEVYLNGSRVSQPQLTNATKLDVTEQIRSGKNTIAIKVTNKTPGGQGLAVSLDIATNGQLAKTIVTDRTWRTSKKPLPFWNRPFYSDAKWPLAKPMESSVNANNTIAELNNAAIPERNNNPGRNIDPPRNTVANNRLTQPESTPPRTTDQRAGSDGKIHPRQLATPDFAVPNEFKVEHIAANRHVGSLIAMEFNEFGQIIASRENGPLLRIFDSDENGSFDKVEECCQEVNNVQGIIPLNGELIVSGTGNDGAAIYRLADQNQDGYFEDISLVLKFHGKEGEHGAHALLLGPDGFIYALLGNHASVDGKVVESSPYRHWYEGDLIPRLEDPGGHASGIKAPGGTVIRFKINGENLEMFAGGLRNPYDMAFDVDGQLFTHDADMESDEGTPWYRQTRILHLVPGAEFGWRSGWAKWPEYFHDSLPPVANTGRGSPTGLVIYDHHAFPSRYRNTLFSGDWSSGKILVFKNDQTGAGFAAKPVAFLKGKPLNVTDLSVGPDGWLYFATGGRGTHGSIYRVVWKGKLPSEATLGEGIDRVLRQPQPQSAFSRQQIAMLQSRMGANWKPSIMNAVLDAKRPANERIRGLYLMKLYGPVPSNDLLMTISRAKDTKLRAAAVYYMALSSDGTFESRLLELLKDEEPHVRRAACEALQRRGDPVSIANIEKLLGSEDRHEAWAARRLLEKTPAEKWRQHVLQSPNHRVFVQGATALMLISPDKETANQVVARGMKIMDGFVSDPTFIDLMRLFQIAIHRSQSTANDLPELVELVAEEYPSSNDIINRELIRLLSSLQVDSIMDRYFSELDRKELPSSERIHLAIHLAYLKKGWTKERKFKLLEHLTPPANTGNSVPGYLQNISLEFGKNLTKEEANAAIRQGSRWPNAAMAAVLQIAEKLTPEQIEQLKQLDKKLANDQTDATKRLKVVIVAVLSRDGSESSLQYLREVYDRNEERRVEIAYGLSENMTKENWDYLIRSLMILDKPSAREIVKKLRSVNKWPTSGEHFRTVIRVAEKLGDDGADDAIALLEHWRGFAPSNGRIAWKQAIRAWTRWYSDKYPDLPLQDAAPIVSKSLFDKTQSVAEIDSNAKIARVTKVNGKWNQDELMAHLLVALRDNQGSSTRGRAVFAKAECSKCHKYEDLGEAMGPVLTNISSRFRTSEILESIVNPSKNVSDQYAAKTIITSDGKTYHGIVAAGVGDQISILQSNGRKVRVRSDEIENILDRKSSAMPDGLLDELTIHEIVDLFTFMSATSEVRVSDRANPQRKIE